ncbi:F1 sector of membrane-bound ATP synthase, alpha subunit [Desulfosarcina cetonica]|uniref:alternate F1F0 ATPase, F1 subunit alpha n=1 Tax=Desulfosarcina cetonica TaxID=90730 RepID=UPI0006CFEC0D|nr:alternate F1F0 ATPase, F1 subunit alpha [Desulfosarcina cetonica]VTR70082.1 F1 sector of membrane-bound ATP synthase, alpha subunit [Desulfosarcina cetonica]
MNQKHHRLETSGLADVLADVDRAVKQGVEHFSPDLKTGEVGRVHSVGQGIAWVDGLGQVQFEEQVAVGPDVAGMVLDILPDKVGVILFGPSETIRAGDEVRRSGRVLEVPVGEGLVGRVVDPLGRPLDGRGNVDSRDDRTVLHDAPPIMDRAPVVRPLQTGLKVIDALIPIGRGQRELILGDRQTGKTAVALDTIINQNGKDVLCIYCAIGQRSSGTARVIEALSRNGAMAYSVVIVVDADAPPGLQYIAPYAATSLGEHFMEAGRDVLIVYDDLTRHAVAYRQLSLLLRRPPGREAFPGDIFYVHSRLLERATHLREELGGGSLTALAIAETEAQNISAYIPTNLISITDGQIYLSPELFQKGVLPAVDVGKSVSRVGGKAQLPAYRQVAGALRLSYTQFQELASFARFGTRLDERTRRTLEHGRRVRAVLRQNERLTMPAGQQIAVLFAVSQGLLDAVPEGRMDEAERAVIEAATAGIADFEDAVSRAGDGDPLWDRLTHLITAAIGPFKEEHADAGDTDPQDPDRP